MNSYFTLNDNTHFLALYKCFHRHFFFRTLFSRIYCKMIEFVCWHQWQCWAWSSLRFTILFWRKFIFKWKTRTVSLNGITLIDSLLVLPLSRFVFRARIDFIASSFFLFFFPFQIHRRIHLYYVFHVFRSFNGSTGELKIRRKLTYMWNMLFNIASTYVAVYLLNTRI